MGMFKKQFLLTSEKGFDYPWNHVEIDTYTLYSHPELEYTCAKDPNVEIHLLGSIYDWENPQDSNSQILSRFLNSSSFEAFIEKLSKCAGQFVLIYKSEKCLVILNDACGQKEVYYNTDLTAYGSQPRLLQKVTTLQPHQDNSAREFFTSAIFLKNRVFAGEATQSENIRHLLPNHFIDIKNKEVRRFFPLIPLATIHLDEAAGKACRMISGIIEAIAARSKIAMAVTAGYDSRVLFLASRDVECQYFVSKHAHMNDNHHDIVVPKKLTNLYGKEFLIIPDLLYNESLYGREYELSNDFPRYHPLASKYFKGHIYLNGNISEIARNYFGYYNDLSPEDLAYLAGYPNMKFASIEFRKWKERSIESFTSNNYNFLDMFYWEDKMGNWAAKAKTEWGSLGISLLSPFNSRELLMTLLSTERKFRDSSNNLLYNEIIRIFSPEALDIPVNPCLSKKVIKWMKSLGVYNHYRNILLKRRF
jgi:hypothetical protein